MGSRSLTDILVETGCLEMYSRFFYAIPFERWDLPLFLYALCWNTMEWFMSTLWNILTTAIYKISHFNHLQGTAFHHLQVIHLACIFYRTPSHSQTAYYTIHPMVLTFVSMKVHGLNSPFKRRAMWQEAKSLRSDVLCVQETHFADQKISRDYSVKYWPWV